jgi:hypothetical protein
VRTKKERVREKDRESEGKRERVRKKERELGKERRKEGGCE